MLRRLVFFSVLFSCSITLSGCARQPPSPQPLPAVTAAPLALGTPMATPPQVLRYALAPLQSPAGSRWECSPRSNVLLNVVYETLVYLNESYLFEPSLAESWSASPDNTAFTFRLNPAVSFHDGTPFNAAAVRHNLDRVAAVDTASSALFPGYLGTDELDRFTVRVRFAAPYPAFLSILSGACLAMLSPATFAVDSAASQPFPSGTGPFMVAPGQVASAQSLTLLRNERYHWGPASYRHRGPTYVGSGYDAAESSGPCRYADRAHEQVGPALLSRIELRFEADPARRAAALEAGEVDAAEDLQTEDAVRLQRIGDFWIYAVPADGHADMVDDPLALRSARIDAQRQEPADLKVGSNLQSVVFHGARRQINCLAYGVHTWDPNFYGADIRALP